MHKKTLVKTLNVVFVRYIVITVMLVEIIVMNVNTLYHKKNIDTYADNLIEGVTHDIDHTVMHTADLIQSQLSHITQLVDLMQKEHEIYFMRPESIIIPYGEPEFEVNDQGVLYKSNDNGGSSLYYSSMSQTDNQDKTRRAFRSEILDVSLKGTVDGNPLIVQAYLNTSDGMTRLYPALPDLVDLLGPAFDATRYNFYYLATQEYNPNRQVVWTEVYFDPAGQGWIVSSIAPIYNEGRLEGVVGVDITIKQLIKQLLDVRVPVDSAVILSDGDGKVIAMNQQAEAFLALKEMSDLSYQTTIDETIIKPDAFNLLSYHTEEIANGMVKTFLNHENGNHKTRFNVRGQAYDAVISAIASTDWKLLVVTNEALIRAPVEHMIKDLNKSNLQLWLFLTGINILLILLLYQTSKKTAYRLSGPPVEMAYQLKKMVNDPKIKPILDHYEVSEYESLREGIIQLNHAVLTRQEDIEKMKVGYAQNQVMVSKYKVQSNTDAMTSLSNRRKAEDYLDSELQRVVRYHHPLSVILIDIDHFKRINDTYGHTTGDEVLIDIAKLLQSNVRQTDLVSRWGGEEFLIICPETNESQADQLANKLRMVIANSDFTTVEKQTASFGVADTKKMQVTTKRALLRAVDQALYLAKETGRNKVVLASTMEVKDLS